MRILVWDRQSGLYYSGPGAWVESAEKAKDFEAFDHAARAYDLEKWGKVDVIFRYERPACDLRVPLGT